uniref:Uncharacterized protein n=1 Tax=Chenopodium quinoa TaxID=63459 RepID=A0A803M8P1_CHEQI
MAENDQNQEIYYFEVKWILLFVINMLRPEVFLFFSYHPSIQSFFKVTLLIAVLILFLALSFRTYLYKLHNCYVVILWIELVVQYGQRWPVFPITALIFSLICPAPVFYYFRPFIPLLCIWPSLKTLICRVFCCHHTNKRQHQTPQLELTLESLYYYDLRWVLLFFITWFLRPYLAYFFFDHIDACPQKLLKAFLLISGASLACLSTSLKICFTEDDNRHLLTLLQIRFLDGWSLLITIAFAFSLLCPTPVFLYLYPWILLLSLWPSFSLSFLSHLYLRLYTALSVFLSIGLPIIPSPPEPQDEEVPDPAILV